MEACEICGVVYNICTKIHAKYEKLQSFKSHRVTLLLLSYASATDFSATDLQFLCAGKLKSTRRISDKDFLSVSIHAIFSFLLIFKI